MSLKTIDTINIANKKVFVRVDFNVPLDKTTFTVTDNTRIKAALPTIQKIIENNGVAILASHLGRPKSGYEDKYSLKHIVSEVEKLIGKPIHFATDSVGESVKNQIDQLKGGEVILLENLRFHPEEEKGDNAFAKQLADLADIYINDAFGTAHRAHASTAVMAQFFAPTDKAFGYLMAAEVASAEKVINEAAKPFTAIIGGAKVSDKILIIENLLSKAQHILIGGGMAYTFFKANGGSIGNSLVEIDKLDLAKNLLQKAASLGVKIHLPIDSVCADKFANDAATKVTPSDAIPDGWMGLDIGEKAIEEFSAVIAASKTILWNGPMGVFEMSAFQNGTKAIAFAVAAATEKGAFSLIGGGDSVAAINQFSLAEKVSYVSTGGGAMLEFFEGKQLPGIDAIK